jgi:alpha-beta hydrolase superfamily lysophospholipase
MTTQLQSKPANPVRIPIEGAALHGDLRLPQDPRGLVIFVHGSGSSRMSPRNRHVAEELNQRGLATLLLDLLTQDEQRIDDRTMQYRFDISLLAGRSTLSAQWALAQPALGRLPLGLFGASTGAAAALITAAEMAPNQRIAAVVSRGGRPDLAEDALPNVKVPTLLIVGGDDETVLALNRKAMVEMSCLNHLHVVPGATHLFEEPGALEEVVRVAAEWFSQHFDKEGSRPKQERAAG